MYSRGIHQSQDCKKSFHMKNKYKGFAQKSSSYDIGRQTFNEHDVETVLHQPGDVLSGQQNELIDGDDTKNKNHGNGNTPSDLGNTNGTDSKDTDQFNGNGTASEGQHNGMGPSPNNMINGNGSTLEEDCNGKIPSAGRKRVKHKQGILKKVGKLWSHDEREWIKCRVDAEDGLPYSGKFHNGMMSMKLHGDGCLLTSSHKYIALVYIDRNDELDSAIDFKQAKTILLKNLKRVELIRDVDSAIAKEAKEKFEKFMTELSNNSFEVVENAGDLFQLSMMLQQFKSDRKNLLEHINKNQYVSNQLKQTIDEYVKACGNFEKRKGMIEFIKNFFSGSKHSWIEVLEDTLKRGAAVHKQKALDTCPAFMKNKFGSIPDSNVFFVISSDLKLFSDMYNTLDKEMFESVLSALADKYCETISKIQPNDSIKVTPITNPIYFYLCKSLTDVVKEINARTKDQKYDVWYAFDEWNHSNFPWVSSLMDKCFERELKMLIDMLNHFEPGKPSALQKFAYEYKIFRSISKSNQQQVLPTEVQVWLCLLDDTIENVLHKDKNIDQHCSYLLALYKSCSDSNSSTMDSMESLRVITHNTIKYLALGAPFFNSKHGLDREITLSQINTMKRATVGGQMSFLDYRDLVEVFGQYWKQRGEFADGITAKLPGEYFKKHVANIQDILLQCMRDALRKNVGLAELISFCRAYEELLVDLLDVPLDWYVRLEQGETHDFVVKRELVELVKNNWQDSEHKCYRVTNIVKFTARLTSEEEEHPKHYILETVKNLLKSIYNMMVAGNWKGGARLTELEQISSASLMIASVRSCLIYLKEQPDYIDFDKYLEENSKPFETLSEKCTSFEEFKKRVLMIKESFWYIRNQNAIGIDEALRLFNLNNDNNFNEEYLRAAFQKYNELFELYMAGNETLTSEEKIKHIVTEVKATVVNKLTPGWDFEFKQTILPRLLAGMGAVWALHASKDVASTGHYLKPHCIQVLGVLRLLSADNDSLGVMKHLAQILTGQGKSLVLGMTANLLALCGHSVTIMCYSGYLATRDQQDFDEFYNHFSVRSKVEYKTFREAAYEEFTKYSSNAKAHIHKCLDVALSSNMNQFSSTANPVLLIDEVDVFFNEQLYGETSNLIEKPNICGLGEIQIEIWRLVTNGVQNIRPDIDTFIKKNTSNKLANFNALMNKPKSYMLLETTGDSIVEKEYNNLNLFSNHINQMIRDAIAVYSNKDNKKFISDYRINENGKICFKTGFGVYCESYFHSYYNTFVYFLLKKQDFLPENYGYLMLDLGCTSYAKLPESYPLILGVTGTLTTLGQYEKKVVQQYYNITESSVMPSYFGSSNLQFDENRDVKCYQTITEWMNIIFSRINAMVNAKRAVLVIFDTEETINSFKQQFGGKLDRLNVLTINTNPNDKERLITESGVSRTITLATREMGRGVDYKSSLTVEKKGGVHVIQTFFSLDVKEETQIKGRTARKDHRGSYEMILCYVDLKGLNLKVGDCASRISYQKLSEARDKYNLKNDNTRDIKVQKSNKMHEKTIEFYGKL